MTAFHRYRVLGAASGVLAVVVALAIIGTGASAKSTRESSRATGKTASAVAWAERIVKQSEDAPIVYHGPTSAPKFPKNKTVALVIQTSDAQDESSVRSWKALQAATKAVGWHAVEVVEPDLNTGFQDAVNEHVSGIFTWGADQTTIEGIDAAKKAGIPIVAAYTSIIPQNEKLFTHIVDQKYPQQGVDSAASVIALTGGKARIGIFSTTPDPSDPSSIDIALDNFKKAIAQHGGAKIVASTYFSLDALGTPSALAQQAVAFLQSHPDVNVIWTPFAQPAEDIDEALIAAGLDKRVKLFTFEGSSLNLDYLRKGELVVSDIAAPLEWMSYAVVQDFDDIFNHKTVPDENLPIKILTKSDLPPAGQSWTGQIDYAKYYLKAWGVDK